MIKIILYIIFSFFVSSNIFGQVEAPSFLCVKSDTLFWDLPTNSCGPFVAYNVYASDNINGPFFLLGSVTDPTQTSYYHDNAGSSVWFYYLESDFDCPGEPVLSSVILNNLAPEASPILVINVFNNTVQIEWQPSPSPQVIGYIIYKTTAIGTIPIDTVYSSTTYIDLSGNADAQSEQYYVIGLDPCGNTSLLQSPHQTVFINGTVSPCEQNARLSWNLYKGWDNGIERQELWVQKDGGTTELVTTLSPSDTSYIFEELDDGSSYCLFIQSHQSGSSVFSISNQFCFTASIVQPMRNITLLNASVNNNNEVTINWQWDTNAEINTTQILQSAENGGGLNLLEESAPSMPLIVDNSYLDQMSFPQNGVISYQIQTIDNCDSIARSNQISTIFLSGVADAFLKNQLSWTAFQSSVGTVNSYELFRQDNSGTYSIGVFDADKFNYADPVNSRVQSDANVCYFILAEVKVDLPDGSQTVVYSQSNKVCVEQQSAILSPNAFVPGGKNPEFKPLLVFGDQVAYTMTIWDRWGQVIFESNNVNEGWTGRKGYLEYPGGAYTFLITITQPNGRMVEDRGIVILVR